MCKQLKDITDEDMKGLAGFLILEDDEIIEIRRGETWVALDWKDEWSVGTIFVSNDKVTFQNDNQHGDPQNAEFCEIQWLLNRGYKIFDKGDD